MGIFVTLPKKHYSVVLADPPWAFQQTPGGSADKKYPVLSVDDICKLPVSEITNPDCFLFLWWVASQPLEALRVVEAWGFTFKTMTGFTWVKQTRTHRQFYGLGFWTRQGAENCLIATKGSPKRASKGVRAVIIETNVRHSEKPLQSYDRIVELCGDVPRIELFARQEKRGWDSWGNDVQPYEEGVERFL